MPNMHSDVVGSLLRPASLLAAREQLEQQAITPVAFKAIEDRAVDGAVALQQNAGLDVITDGEFVAPETPVTVVQSDGMRVVVKPIAA